MEAPTFTRTTGFTGAQRWTGRILAGLAVLYFVYAIGNLYFLLYPSHLDLASAEPTSGSAARFAGSLAMIAVSIMGVAGSLGPARLFWLICLGDAGIRMLLRLGGSAILSGDASLRMLGVAQFSVVAMAMAALFLHHRRHPFSLVARGSRAEHAV